VTVPRGFFTDIRTGIGTTIGRGVQTLAFEKIVLDELQVRIVGELLVVGFQIPGVLAFCGTPGQVTASSSSQSGSSPSKT
jgi:hypothetical protein